MKGICHEVTWDRRVPTEGRVREAARLTFEVIVASTLRPGKSSRESGREAQCRASEEKALHNLNKSEPRSESCCHGLAPGTTRGQPPTGKGRSQEDTEKTNRIIEAKCDGGSGQGHSRAGGEQQVASKYIVKVAPARALEAPWGDA